LYKSYNADNSDEGNVNDAWDGDIEKEKNTKIAKSEKTFIVVMAVNILLFTTKKEKYFKSIYGHKIIGTKCSGAILKNAVSTNIFQRVESPGCHTFNFFFSQ
jgi:hypothetical protein